MIPRLKLVLPLIAVLLVALLVAPTSAGRNVPKTLAGFRYLEVLTAGATEGQHLPLIVGLHFFGSTPQVAARYFGELDFPARVLLPQGHVHLLLGYSWYSETEEVGDAESTAALRTAVEELAKFVTEAKDTFPTRGRPVVIGASHGGDVAFALALDHPKLLAAAFPIAAELPRELWPQPPVAKNGWPAIHVFHGSDDRIVPITLVRRTVAHLNQIGIKTELNEYVGIGHSIPEPMMRQYTRMLEETVGR